MMENRGLMFAGHSESFLHAADLFRSLGKTVSTRRPAAIADAEDCREHPRLRRTSGDQSLLRPAFRGPGGQDSAGGVFRHHPGHVAGDRPGLLRRGLHPRCGFGGGRHESLHASRRRGTRSAEYLRPLRHLCHGSAHQSPPETGGAPQSSGGQGLRGGAVMESLSSSNVG